MKREELTLAALHARCDEVGDCLLWNGSMSGGSPQVYISDKVIGSRPAGGAYIQARRAVYELASGRPIRRGYSPVMKCREPRCLCFDHMMLLTVKQIAQLASREGAFSSMQRSAAIVAGWRRSGKTKVNLEIARAIRASDESGPVLAQRHGIHRSLVRRIKRNEAWRETTANASVFNLARRA